MSWKCHTCGSTHEDLPTCFGCEAPWRDLVPEAEREQRVDLTQDQCVVDEKHFFIRGHLCIPIIDPPQTQMLELAVWSSLSEKSFCHMCDRWEDADRGDDPPYFGWLSSRLPGYPDTLHLKLSVQNRAPGLVPLLFTEHTEHPLSMDQHNGITVERWHELVHVFMGGRKELS